jgi:hypothetical protein
MNPETSTDIWAVAQSPIIWVCALAVFAIIAAQSFIYMRAVKRAGEDVGVSKKDLNRGFRSGAVASIGPSLAVVLVAIALLALFGSPAVLMRIGLVGSAATETASASIAADTMGADLGGDEWTQQVFVVAFFAMTLSGAAWMVMTLIFTPILKRGGKKLSKVNPAAMAIIPGSALIAAFMALTITELPKSAIHVIAVAISAAAMVIMLFIAKRFNQGWLKEWALGLSIIIALVIVYFVHHGYVGNFAPPAV